MIDSEIITPHTEAWVKYNKSHRIQIRFKWMMGYNMIEALSKKHWNHSLVIL